jgi:potassium-transporting ATPase KdpC subunit
MIKHIRAHFLLAALTLLLCCVAYPLILLGAGKLLPERAEGNLIRNKNGEVVGSKLIARKFTGQGYFWPRPSAADYNASASAGSNWGANNIKLRDRAARLLGPVARYASGPKKGDLVGPDIDAWFAAKTDPTKVKPGEDDLVTVWARDYPTLAGAWVGLDPENKKYVEDWSGKPGHADLVALWKKDNPDGGDKPKTEDLAKYFFADFARTTPGKWPVADDKKDEKGETVKDAEGKPVREMTFVTEGDGLRATFFDLWLRAERPDLEKVPADYVTASGSGLDPHISLRNARFQSRRVVEERAKIYREKREKEGGPVPGAQRAEAAVGRAVDRLIDDQAFSPMWGLAGGDRLVNVLELNLALDEAMSKLTVE